VEVNPCHRLTESLSQLGGVLAARPLSPVELMHVRMITRLAVTKPNRIIGAFADRADVEDRAQHLAAVMAAVVEYAIISLPPARDRPTRGRC
jgi:hypothetical protein